MTNLLEINLSYLKEHQTIIYKEVISYMSATEHSSSFLLTTEPLLNIQCTIQQESFLLYSKYDPQYECERWIEAIEIDTGVETDFVVYGLGLTYHLTQIIKKYPHVKLFIYEPEIGVFVEALKVINVEELFTNKNIANISVGKSRETLNWYTNFLYYYAKFPIRVLDMPIYRTLNTELFFTFLKLIEKITLNRIFRKGFYEKFGDQMFQNSLLNLIHMYKTPSLDILKGKFRGCTAIVVGGGPSLQHDIECLKLYRDKCLVIAAGSSVQSLIHLGVEPHLIVSMDPGIYNSNVFTRNSINHIPLLYMPQIHHNIIEIHNKYNVFAYYSNDVIINKLIDVDKKDYTFQPTYSVTGTAIQAAIYLGASTVLFTGQDLSYPGKQVYSPGAIHLDILKNNKPIDELTLEADNVEGGKNPTTLSMKTTLENIESIIDSYPEVLFINSSSKGAVIKGTQYMNLETAINSHTTRSYEYTEIKTLIMNSEVTAHPDFLHVREKSIEIITALTEFTKVCTVVGRQLEKLIVLSKENEVKAEEVLRAIEAKWEVVIRHPIFKELVEELMSNELNIYDQKILDVALETNIVEKSKLLQETLGSFCLHMKARLEKLKEEYLRLLHYIK